MQISEADLEGILFLNSPLPTELKLLHWTFKRSKSLYSVLQTCLHSSNPKSPLLLLTRWSQYSTRKCCQHYRSILTGAKVPVLVSYMQHYSTAIRRRTTGRRIIQDAFLDTGKSSTMKSMRRSLWVQRCFLVTQRCHDAVLIKWHELIQEDFPAFASNLSLPMAVSFSCYAFNATHGVRVQLFWLCCEVVLALYN